MQTSVFENIFEGIYIIVRVRASPCAPCVCDRLNMRITDTNMRILDITASKALQVLNSSLSLDRAEVNTKDYAEYAGAGAIVCLFFFHAIVHKCLLFICLKYICYTMPISCLCPAYILPMIGLCSPYDRLIHPSCVC